MPTPLNFNVSRALDENGNPLPGAKAYFYQTGTTTPITVFSDEAETTPHATPVVADSEGVFPTVYYSAAQCKVTVTDASGAVLTGYPLEAAGSFGTIATQDADAVAVTGGTINNTPIGGTTPAAGAFTTLAASGLATLSGGATASGTLAGFVGRLLAIQTFTASGTYTPTTGTKTAVIRMFGGGGGGGGADSDTDNAQFGAGGGGGAGAHIFGTLDVSAPAYSATLTIGAGGTAGDGAGVGTNGGAGGNTTYTDGTTTWTAGGGSGGETKVDSGLLASHAPGGAGGSVVAATGAVLSMAGNPGSNGFGTRPGTGANQAAFGGMGGPSMLGAAGSNGTSGNNGTAIAGGDASGYGAGGSGGATIGATSPVLGGVGAPGLIVIEEYSA